jgi:hypothetical protein
MFFNKHKKNVNKELEEIQDDVKMKRALGANYVCLPITSHNTDLIRDWCAREGYKFEVDHMTDDIFYYKISGWD